MSTVDEKAEIVMKVLANLEKKAQDVSEGPIEEMRSDPQDLQMSPEGEARKEGKIPDVNEVVATPEDAEGICVESKMAKGVPEGQARMECAQGDKTVTETLPEDADKLARESADKDQEEEKAEEKPKSCVEKAMEAGKSEAEAKAECEPKGEATDAKLDALEKQVDELIVLKARQDAKVAQDNERLEKAKAFLVDSITEKTSGGYTQDFLQKKNVCYLQALDGFVDQGLKAAIESQSGRIQGYPVVKDSKVKPVEFERPYVGKMSKDGKSYERI